MQSKSTVVWCDKISPWIPPTLANLKATTNTLTLICIKYLNNEYVYHYKVIDGTTRDY